VDSPIRQFPVAVILVTFNSAAYLSQTLTALRLQTILPKRVLVVDNGSTDDSVAVAQATYPSVEIVRSAENLGFAKANNLAVDMSDDCEFVALLNADASPQPRWLEELANATEGRPNCASFGSRLIQAAADETMDGTGDVYHTSGMAWRRDHGQLASQPSEKVPTIGACAAAALYRRDAFQKVGGFDNDYFCYLEDVDLSLRLRLAGYDYHYVPTAVAIHVGAASSIRHSDFYVYHGQRNLVWTYMKNMPGPLFWKFLLPHVLLNLASIVWFSLRGQARPILKSKRDALRGLLAVWHKRRMIQHHRKATTAELHALLARGFWRPYLRQFFA
jgi:GT2 family glycosyltransferase